MNNKSSNRRSSDEAQEFGVSFIPNKGGTYRIEINDGIDSVSQFSTAIMVLQNAGPDDIVEIHLQTPGGSLGATDAFIHALHKFEGHIHVVATGLVASAGTIILLEADSIEFSENFNALIHNGSTGAGGTMAEVRAESKFFNDFWPKQFHAWYEFFLTKEEIDGMLDGRDIWLDSEQWLARAKAREALIIDKFTQLTKPARKSRTKKPVDSNQSK